MDMKLLVNQFSQYFWAPEMEVLHVAVISKWYTFVKNP